MKVLIHGLPNVLIWSTSEKDAVVSTTTGFKTVQEAREEAQSLRALVTLADMAGLVLRTHLVAHNHPYLQSNTLF